MKKIMSKLRSRAGETFSEVLIALLIVALSAFLLSALVTSSGQVDMAVRRADESFYDSVSELEKRDTTTPSEGELTVKVSEAEVKNTDGTTPIFVKESQVDVYIYKSGGMISYSAKEDAT